MASRLSQLRGNKSVPTDIGTGDPEELLVFGYQCKLFRDDEKAVYVEEEKHLIPWMGDTSLMIDRYDGRGHLHDLGQYDADINPINDEMLTDEEKHIEAICDEERYMELHVDLADKAMYEEEELKRLHQELAADESSAPYQAVGFSYEQYDPAEPTQDASAMQGNDGTEDPADDEDERGLFIPAPELHIPPHMECPTSMKLNSIIEKTAEFVSKHGGQMEIMIKTKQSANPQFGFLIFEHSLNPYYKHMVSMIKCGRYIPGLHKPQMQASDPSSSSSDNDDDDDGGYLHPSLRPSISTQNLPKLPALTSSQIENTSYGMLIKRIGIIAGTASPAPASCSSRQASPSEKDLNQEDENALYDIPPPPGTEDVLLPDVPPKPPSPAVPKAAVAPASPERANITSIPPIDVKTIIDRMASYVVKDGIEFENQVRAQSDLRFEFLNSSHPHNAYYEDAKSKIATEEKEPAPTSKAVSFSIKFKDQDAGLLEKKASFLLNDSSDEENEHKQTAVIASTAAATAAEQQKSSLPVAPSSGIEESQKKLSEQRLKDKLAAAAREKLAQTTKESKHRLLQEERKKRAAMFVTMLKTGGKSELHNAPIGPDLPNISTKRSSNKESSPREGRSTSGAHSSHTRSPRRSGSRSTHHRHRSKSRSPLKKHSRASTNRSSYTRSRKSRSPELDSKHTKHKHSRKSKIRHRSRSPLEQESTVKQEQSPNVDRLAQQSTAREAGTLDLNSQARNQITDNYKYQKAENHKNQTCESSANGKPPSLEPPSEDMIVKVRKMLQASRKAIFKEDMIGD